MKYLCGRCIHIDACLVPRSTGCVEECKYFKEMPSHLPKQTNEEWLRSCPPQELIRFLMNVAYGGQIRSVQKSTFDEEAEKWSKWLKEKHTE